MSYRVQYPPLNQKLLGTDQTISKPWAMFFERISSASAVINLRDAGADFTGVKDVAPVLAKVISDADTGDTIYIPKGVYKISTPVVFDKVINFYGEGTRSVLWIEDLAGEDAITFGPLATTWRFGVHWRNFAILGGAACCDRMLVLGRIVDSRFDNVHVLGGAAVAAVHIQWATVNRFGFIISYNSAEEGVYPENPAQPYKGILCAAANGDPSVFNANRFPCIIEQCADDALRIVQADETGNNDISGTYQNNIGAGVYITGGMRAHLHDLHSENGSATETNRNRIIIEDHTFAHIGPNVTSGTPIDGYYDVELWNCDDTFIDGLFVSRIHVESDCGYTNIANMKLWAAVGAASLYDESGLVQWHPMFTGSATWNPPDIAAGDYTAQAFTCAGAEFGMTAGFAAPYTTGNLVGSAYVSGSSQVVVILHNPTGGAINLAEGTWKVWAMRV
jgi:hypothetical protein